MLVVIIPHSSPYEVCYTFHSHFKATPSNLSRLLHLPCPNGTSIIPNTVHQTFQQPCTLRMLLITRTDLVIWMGVVDGDKSSRELCISSCDLPNDDATYRAGYAMSICKSDMHESQIPEEQGHLQCPHQNTCRESTCTWTKQPLNDPTTLCECYDHTIYTELVVDCTTMHVSLT